MFLHKETYDKIVSDWLEERQQRTVAQEKFNVLSDRVTALQTTLDWFMVRVTQLEKERAALLMVVTHGEVRIETPVISRDPVSPIPQNAPVDAMDLFTDMGDDKATQLGIGWNDDGTLKRL